MLGIQQGNITPTELPEFQRMQSMWKTGSNDQLQNLVRMLAQSGVQGGKANQAINAITQGNQNGLLNLIQSIYSQANQRGAQAANTGLDWQKYLMSLWQQGHTQRQQNRQAQNRMWMDLGTRLASTIAGGLAGLDGSGQQGTTAGIQGDVGGLAGSGGMTEWYMKNLYGR